MEYCIIRILSSMSGINCNNPHSVTNMIKNNPQFDPVFSNNYPQSVTLIYIFTTYINNIN
jgi:hypothetical protein